MLTRIIRAPLTRLASSRPRQLLFSVAKRTNHDYFGHYDWVSDPANPASPCSALNPANPASPLNVINLSSSTQHEMKENAIKIEAKKNTPHLSTNEVKGTEKKDALFLGLTLFFTGANIALTVANIIHTSTTHAPNRDFKKS